MLLSKAYMLRRAVCSLHSAGMQLPAANSCLNEADITTAVLLSLLRPAGRGACYPGSSKKGSKVVIIGCPALHQALVDDGAVRVTRQKALSRQSEKGHYIAAMARPDFKDCVSGYCSKTDILSEKDFLRKDISGSWSFKFPGMPATDRDLEGQLITDPEAAPLPGLYVVCGYYQVDPRVSLICRRTYHVRYCQCASGSVSVAPLHHSPAWDSQSPIVWGVCVSLVVW